jgi:NADP-dependent 3-hydroxy acid dehydrogenase YdfG
MGRREEILKSAVVRLESEGIKAMYYAGDVRRAETCEMAVRSVLERFGQLNIRTFTQ